MRKNGMISLMTLWMLGVVSLSAQECRPNWCSSTPCESYCGLIEEQFYIDAEWLYWKATQDGLELGMITDVPFSLSSSSTALSTTSKGKDILLNYKWTNGYRVNVGYDVPCYDLELAATYSYLPSSASVRVGHSAHTQYIETILFSGIIEVGLLGDAANFPLNQLDADWDLRFTYADFDFARNICLGSCFSVKPHVGFRGLWTDQRLNVATLGTFVSRTSAQEVTGESKLNEKLRGYGVEAGLWANWQVGCGLSVIGHLGGALLYSHNHVSKSLSTELDRVSLPSNDLSVVTHQIFLKDKFWTTTPMADVFLGMQYAFCMLDTSIYIRAAWEQHVLFDVNQWSTGGGNLGLQGLTLGAGISF